MGSRKKVEQQMRAERDRLLLTEYLDELDEEFGPPDLPPEEVAEIEAVFDGKEALRNSELGGSWDDDVSGGWR